MIIHFEPLDDQGIVLNRPPHQVRWTKLQDVMFRDGRLVPRPGIKPWSGIYAYDLPSVVHNPIVAISEVQNPGSSATGRNNVTWALDSLHPNSSDNDVAGWSNSYTNVDETGAPDGLVQSSTTLGAQVRYGFTNTSDAYDQVYGYILQGRARTGGIGQEHTLRFYHRYNSVNYQIGDRVITARSDNESNNWDHFSILVVGTSDFPLAASSDLDALEIVMEHNSASEVVRERAAFDGNGNYQEFQDAQDQGTAVYADIDWSDVGSHITLPADDFYGERTRPRGWVADTDGDKQSVTLAALNETFTSIDQVTVQATITMAAPLPVGVNVYVRSAGTDYLGASQTLQNRWTDAYGTVHYNVNFTMTENPVDEAAWESADITGLEIVLERSGAQFVVESLQVLVEGKNTGGTVLVDKIWVEAIGGDDIVSGGDGYQIATSRLAHLEFDDDSVTDVTDSSPPNDTPAILPLDHAVLYGQIYIVNGSDNTMRFPDGASNFEYLSTNNSGGSTPITGKTVAAFADRILYGWVKDNTTITPERFAWSKIFDGGTHNHASAGDADIIDTPGGIVKLLALNESICFCGKEQGVYVLRRTGNDAFPIVVDPIDYETRCLSMMSVKRVMRENRPVILFLGWNPTVGYSIFQFDGTSVIPVGDAIAPVLRRKMNKSALNFAFAGIEPLSGSYMIWFPQDTNLTATTAYVMSLRTGAWSTTTWPMDFFSTGTWTRATAGLGGEAKMVLGGPGHIPYELDIELGYDILRTAEDFTADPYPEVPFASSGGQGPYTELISPVVETGDITIDQTEASQQILGYRVHVTYIDRGPFFIRASASVDGGDNWSTSVEYTLGTDDAGGYVRNATLDMDPVHGEQVRFRFQFSGASQTNQEPNFPWEITKISFQVQLGSQDGP